ncbi:MAG: DMT family transporter [Actinomycetota bacterium]|nr:DMT family transporter [Actinomycetota bacterium]
MTALLAIASSLLWGTSDFLGGTLSRRLAPVAVIGVSQALAIAVLLPVVLVTGELTADPAYLGWAVAAGLAGLVGLAAFYRALAAGTMGVVAPLAATGVVVPVAIGLAGGESPHPVQLVGIAVTAAGIVLACGPELHGAGRGGRRPLVLAAVAALGFGLALVFIAKGSRSSAVMTLVAMRVTTVSVLGIAALARRRGPGVVRADLPALAAVGIGDASANGAYAVASQTGLVSVVAVLASLYPVVTVVLARQVHGERMRRVQAVGVLGALTGVVLLAGG